MVYGANSFQAGTRMKYALRYGCFCALLCFNTPLLAQVELGACGDFSSSYGPFDYRTATQDQKDLVERVHFTREVETLVRGKTSTRPGPDLNYTLRVFPNHPRALLAMMKLGKKEKTVRPQGSNYTVECWFDRAVRFQPDDGVAHLLYGTYLAREGKNKEAVAKLEEARTLLGDGDGNAHYNLGLAYTDLKQYDKALEHAHKAYALGFNLPGLRGKLQRAGKWTEPPPKAETSAAAAATPPKPAEPPPAVPETPAGDVPNSPSPQ
jgi:tetratricopeptide (TPR) repeat protein